MCRMAGHISPGFSERGQSVTCASGLGAQVLGSAEGCSRGLGTLVQVGREAGGKREREQERKSSFPSST